MYLCGGDCGVSRILYGDGQRIGVADYGGGVRGEDALDGHVIRIAVDDSGVGADCGVGDTCVPINVLAVARVGDYEQAVVGQLQPLCGVHPFRCIRNAVLVAFGEGLESGKAAVVVRVVAPDESALAPVVVIVGEECAGCGVDAQRELVGVDGGQHVADNPHVGGGSGYVEAVHRIGGVGGYPVVEDAVVEDVGLDVGYVGHMAHGGPVSDGGLTHYHVVGHREAFAGGRCAGGEGEYYAGMCGLRDAGIVDEVSAESLHHAVAECDAVVVAVDARPRDVNVVCERHGIAIVDVCVHVVAVEYFVAVNTNVFQKVGA